MLDSRPFRTLQVVSSSVQGGVPPAQLALGAQ